MGNLKAGRAIVQLAPPVARESTDSAGPLQVGGRGQVPLKDRPQPRSDVVLGVAEEREIGGYEFGMGTVAVLALSM